MAKFVLEISETRDGELVKNGWWKIEGKNVYNRRGGYHSYIPSEHDIVISAKNWDDLCKKEEFKKSLLNENSDLGWIDRNGNFYRCDYHDHSEVAEYVIGVSERELEEKGYIKVFQSFPRFEDIDVFCLKKPTKKQINCLMDNLYKYKNVRRFIRLQEVEYGKM